MNIRYRNILKLFTLIALSFLLITIFQFIFQPEVSEVDNQTAVETLSQYGSRGSEVREIQTRLKNWGYYFGEVDGIFGEKTQDAVIWFQQKNGLTVDGVVGPETLRALGIYSSTQTNSGNASINNADYDLLARVIAAEAKGEVYTGQVAVGAVILNRVEHPSFPDTISGVVYQAGAFESVSIGTIWESVPDSCYRAARDALNGWDPSGGAIYFYNPSKTDNQWIRSRPVIATIGNHVFAN